MPHTGQPTQLTPFFGHPAPAQAQGGGGFDPSTLLGLAGGLQGFLQAGQSGGLGEALLGGAAGGLGGLAQGQQQQFERQDVRGQRQAQQRQQLIQNALAKRKADASAAKVIEDRRLSDVGQSEFAATEGRLGGAAESTAALGRGNLELRRKEFERGLKPDLQVETVRMPDGSVRSFRRNDPALDQALGQGGVRFSAQLQATDLAGLGGATTSTQTRAQGTIDAATDTLGVIQQFRDTLRPENIGLSGNIRELGIGALGQAESFRAWADTNTQSIIDQAIQSGDTLDLSKFAVDPELSTQRLLENILAYRLAKIQDPNGRISDKDFANAKLSLGTGKKLSSIGDVMARLDAFEKTVQRTQGIAQKRLGLDVGQAGGPTPTILRFDAQGNIIP